MSAKRQHRQKPCLCRVKVRCESNQPGWPWTYWLVLGYTGWPEFVNSESAPIVVPADPKQNSQKHRLGPTVFAWQQRWLGFPGLLLLVVVCNSDLLPPHQDLYFQDVRVIVGWSLQLGRL